MARQSLAMTDPSNRRDLVKKKTADSIYNRMQKQYREWRDSGKTIINEAEAAKLIGCTAYLIRRLVIARKLPKPLSMDRRSITFDLAQWIEFLKPDAEERELRRAVAMNPWLK